MTDCDRPVRYMWSPWKCSFCSGKDTYKTTTLTEDQNIPEGALMKEKELLYRKKKKVYLIIRHSHYICLSHRLFFWFPATVQILRFGFIFRFLLLAKKNQNKWVIISYHFVDNVIFVSKHNLTVLIHSFPTRRIQSPTYWN